MTGARVSICIPTYNGASYLAQCLDSALAQSHADLEILIVDDGSRDETVAIAHEYERRDARVRVVVNAANLGLVGNWNRCLELATGTWVKFLFQDDWLEPTCVERMLAAAGNAPMVFCARDFVFESSSPETVQEYAEFVGPTSLAGMFAETFQLDASDFCRALARKPLANFLGEPTSVMLRRDLFTRFGGFDGRYVQLCDFEYSVRVGAQCGMAWVPDVLAHFRVHGSSTTAANQRSKLFAKDVIDPLLLLHDYATEPGYKLFRQICVGSGVDRAAEFHSQLVVQRRWGPHWLSDEWDMAEKRYPFLKMGAVDRIRHSLRRGLHLLSTPS
jgi:glycosyltransferase involved in cell wall biosynthesis